MKQSLVTKLISLFSGRWHYLYYLLAVFDIVTISSSLYLNHAILKIYSESIEDSVYWVNRLNQYDGLALTASLVNAPGNDVFDTLDPVKEKLRLDKNLVVFFSQLHLMKNDITVAQIGPGIKKEIQSHFAKIEIHMNQMVREANQIFAFFSQRQNLKASSRMASMDRQYAILISALSDLRISVRNYQINQLQIEKQKAQEMGNFEFIFAALILIMITGVTWYGHMIAQRIQVANEQIHLQQTLLQTSEKMASLGVMAAGIAHEINNPLGIIGGFTAMIENEMNEPEPNQAFTKKTVIKMHHNIDRIASIIRGLKTFSRDGSKDPFAPVEIGTLVADSISICSAKCKNSSVRIKVHHGSSKQFIECRGVEVSQILVNLINNAVDANEGKSDAWIEITSEINNEDIEIRVTDSGLGIPPAVLEKLMTPFFTTKGVGKGTGLGLSISLGIAESHGGKLSFDSSLPNTCFVLRLPIKQTINPNLSKEA